MYLEIIFAPILFYLTVNVAYYFVFSVASINKLKKITYYGISPARIAVLIPAYKEDAVIVDTASKALIQDYPSELFDVIVIADTLQEETIDRLNRLPIRVVQVSFEKSTKTKAINVALEHLEKSYDLVAILDADNVMGMNVLARMNAAHIAGYSAMQAHRTAKNQNGSMAILDGLSEEINNSIFRRGHMNLGLSSALIGSGMAFEFGMFKRIMHSIKAVGGFDKELELKLLKEGKKIIYLEDAWVYDEKVADTEVFEKQRTRWLAAQFRYAFRSIADATRQLITRGKTDYFDKSFQMLLLPRLILLGILGMLTIASFIPDFPLANWIFGISVAYITALALAIPSRLYTKDLLKAVFLLPKTLWVMFIALTKYKKASGNFLHTPHQMTTP